MPWSTLPDLAAVRPHLDQVTAAVIGALREQVPAYARPLEGAFGEGVRQGVGVALSRFLDLPGTDQPALTSSEREVYVALGRGELRQGRELETLLAAYRSGARVAFREFAAAAGDLPADVLIVLAESVFAYIDELSAASAQGYAREQSLLAGESGRRRSAVLAMLLSPPVDVDAAQAAAHRAGWTLPTELVAVVVPPEHAEALSTALGDAALVGEHDASTVALVAPGPLRALKGRRAVVGPARPWAGVAGSLSLAELAAGVLKLGDAPVRVDEHRVALLPYGLPDLATELADSRLAPLDALASGVRERLAETLLSWLRHRGSRAEVAAELHVHTQTVGYRLGQLRQVFGDALEDPEARFELELALRWRASQASPTT